jgi:hypothetical protein
LAAMVRKENVVMAGQEQSECPLASVLPIPQAGRLRGVSFNALVNPLRRSRARHASCRLHIPKSPLGSRLASWEVAGGCNLFPLRTAAPARLPASLHTSKFITTVGMGRDGEHDMHMYRVASEHNPHCRLCRQLAECVSAIWLTRGTGPRACAGPPCRPTQS